LLKDVKETDEELITQLMNFLHTVIYDTEYLIEIEKEEEDEEEENK